MEHHADGRRIFNDPKSNGGLLQRLIEDSIDIPLGVQRAAVLTTKRWDDMQYGDLGFGVAGHLRSQIEGQSIVFAAEVRNEDLSSLAKTAIDKDGHIGFAAGQNAVNRSAENRAANDRFVETHQYQIGILLLGDTVDIRSHIEADE